MLTTEPLAAKWILKIRTQLGFHRETPNQEALRHKARLASYERRTKLARQFLQNPQQTDTKGTLS